MLSRLVSLAACSAVAAGCGSGPKAPALAHADAKPLAALAQRIAAEGPCAQRRDIRLLQQRAVRLVNAHRVPSRLQEVFMAGVNALAADSPPCLPAVPAAPPAPAKQPKEHGHPKPKHEHGHGKGDD